MNELEWEPLTDRQLYRRAHRKVIKLDPPAAERRHRQQREARALARRLSADGMATLRMYATAQDVAAVWDACTVLADAALVPGDERTLDNRRVDALVDLTTGLLDTGRLPGDEPRAVVAPAPTAGGELTDAEADELDDWTRWAIRLADRSTTTATSTNCRAGRPGPVPRQRPTSTDALHPARLPPIADLHLADWPEFDDPARCAEERAEHPEVHPDDLPDDFCDEPPAAARSTTVAPQPDPTSIPETRAVGADERHRAHRPAARRPHRRRRHPAPRTITAGSRRTSSTTPPSGGSSPTPSPGKSSTSAAPATPPPRRSPGT